MLKNGDVAYNCRLQFVVANVRNKISKSQTCIPARYLMLSFYNILFDIQNVQNLCIKHNIYTIYVICMVSRRFCVNHMLRHHFIHGRNDSRAVRNDPVPYKSLSVSKQLKHIDTREGGNLSLGSLSCPH